MQSNTTHSEEETPQTALQPVTNWQIVAEPQPVSQQATASTTQTRLVRGKRRVGFNINNLPEEIVAFRVKWLVVYTACMIGMAGLATKTWVERQYAPPPAAVVAAPAASNAETETDLSASEIAQKWAYPHAWSGSGSSSGDLVSNQSSTNDSFKQVWEYYARKCGYQGAYATNMGYGSGGNIDASISSQAGKDSAFAHFSRIDKAAGYFVDVNVMTDQALHQNKITLTVGKFPKAKP